MELCVWSFCCRSVVIHSKFQVPAAVTSQACAWFAPPQTTNCTHDERTVDLGWVLRQSMSLLKTCCASSSPSDCQTLCFSSITAGIDGDLVLLPDDLCFIELAWLTSMLYQYKRCSSRSTASRRLLAHMCNSSGHHSKLPSRSRAIKVSLDATDIVRTACQPLDFEQ